MMIKGHAVPAGTEQAAKQFAGLTYQPLGSTGLLVSGAGFGCYRVNAGVVAHEKSLSKALTSGINLIDTSANYADGGSEVLVGKVLADLIATDRIRRNQVVVVSKGGYLQGSNFALSQQRKAEGRPFADLVEYADGLEHCIHPGFLADQLTRSLDRLGIETLDGYLLHNPEYYLGWAHKNGLTLEAARHEYYHRIEQAFRYLETEVQEGRIRFYGVSSNTFPEDPGNPDFTELHRVVEIAASIGTDHHFRLIQFPFNLIEPGAALTANQPTGGTVLAEAIEKRLGVLINRPLNAFTGNRMIRLADIDIRRRMDYPEIINAIKSLAQSETRLWRKILPGVDAIPNGLRVRIKQQGCVAETLKHHWRSFGAYEKWRQAKDGVFLPRIQGVFDFLSHHAGNHPDLAEWLPDHERILDHALRAVGSIYAEEAVVQQKRILDRIARADGQWAGPGTLSQKALRALLSTAGVSAVLVGMRKEAYVDDVLAELNRPIDQIDRRIAWQTLGADVKTGKEVKSPMN